MATKIICDKCGADNAGRVRVDFGVSQPHSTASLPKLDVDLCGGCLATLRELVRDAIDPLEPHNRAT